eukprot:gene8079-8273_t
MPVVVMPDRQSSVAPPQASGFELKLERLVLANAVLAASDAAAPLLWPLGMFTSTATSMRMNDVRLMVSDAQLQQLRQVFSGSGAAVHTDNTSFLHISEWDTPSTRLRSVTLIGPACNISSIAVIPGQDTAASVVSNVSLGQGLQPGAIDIRRPLLVMGLHSQPTSIDFGMVVNQLNVTAPHSAIYWEAVVLENAAPGDAISSVIAPPSSAAMSTNIWAMYCNRYSMYNSPLPNMRKVADFYHTDLRMTTLKFHPGPGDRAITITRMLSSAWDLTNGIWRLEPMVASKLPLPNGLAATLQPMKPAAIVQAIDSCSGWQASLSYPTSPDRQRVWMLFNNFSITADCWRSSVMLSRPTQLFGQAPGSTVLPRQPSKTPYQLVSDASPPPAQPITAATANTTGVLPTWAPMPNVFTLGLGLVQQVLALPDNAPDKFLALHNVTLAQLSQGADAANAAGMSYPAGSSVPTPPGIWTILLWPISRKLSGSPVFLSDVQVVLPKQEYQYIAGQAGSATAFVVQLQGSVGITFTYTTLEGDAVHVGAVQGPGISGQNVWLLQGTDPALPSAQQYIWPFADGTASTSSPAAETKNSSHTTKVIAGVTAGVGTAVLLLLAGIAVWYDRRRWRQQQDEAMEAAFKSDGADRDSKISSRPSSRSGRPGACSSTGVPSSVSISATHLAKDNNCVTLSDDMLPAKDGSRPAHGATTSWGEQHSQASAHGSDAVAADLAVTRVLCIGDDEVYDTSPADHVTAGLRRWRSAVNNTTMQLMERRMQCGQEHAPLSQLAGQPSAAGGAPGYGAAGAQFFRQDSATSLQQQQQQQLPSSLQMVELLGQGSFGCVYLANWRGKRVAVKVMQLPADALLEPQQDAAEQVQGGADQLSKPPGIRSRRRSRGQQNPPHMAIMEAVVSSTMSHPNVVQVYTYMLNPLTATGEAAADASQGSVDAQVVSAAPHRNVSGWELKLVMEYCDQGTLRDALDSRRLSNSTCFLQPALVLSLAHDVAAAMLHLHSEGIVHGDLKAGNVMLTKGGQDPGRVWAATVGYKVTAKVADFGLALPLDPQDTHATMAARGTPTHMSPELFMAGRVSKASDVYAYGILLYEVVTGQRAYAGVPIPLLPHEVARQRLRPQWPPGLPPGCKDLCRLAEACWAQEPQDRPSFQEIFNCLENAHDAPGQVQTPSAVTPAPGKQPGLPPGNQMQVQQQQQQPPHHPVVHVANHLPHCSPRNLSWSEVTVHASGMHPNAP